MNEMDARQDLYERIMIILMSEGIETENISLKIQVALGKYEIENRTTEIALLQEDRNEFLLKKFIIGKMVKGCSKRTIELYSIELKKILEKIGKTVDDITADDIRYYLALRQTRDKVKKVTADNELRYLRTFFQYLIREELVTKNPTARIDRIKCERVKKKAFTDIEVEKLRSAAQTNREKAMVEVLFSTGCRVTELVLMKIEELDGDKIVVHGKGAKDRTVYLNAKAELALKNYLKERKDNNPYIFCGGYPVSNGKARRLKGDWYQFPEYVSDTHVESNSVRQRLVKIGKRVEVEDVHPHKFRRTCATMALRRGMSLEQVSKMLGHEELSTTQIYLDQTEEELQAAHKKYVI